MAGSDGVAAKNQGWSVLGTAFRPSSEWPDLHEVEVIKDRSASIPDENLQKRVYYTELLMYALKRVEPTIADGTIEEKKVARFLIDDVGDAVMQLSRDERVDKLKQATEEAGQPVEPKQTPVMQALREMQSKGAIDYDTRSVLDGIVRAVHLHQSGKV